MSATDDRHADGKRRERAQRRAPARPYWWSRAIVPSVHRAELWHGPTVWARPGDAKPQMNTNEHG